VQIGDENVHRVRAVLDEIFGTANAGDLLLVKKKGGQKGRFPEAVNDSTTLLIDSRTLLSLFAIS
jgi:adenine-specific DNA-methyltransferase